MRFVESEVDRELLKSHFRLEIITDMKKQAHKLAKELMNFWMLQLSEDMYMRFCKVSLCEADYERQLKATDIVIKLIGKNCVGGDELLGYLEGRRVLEKSDFLEVAVAVDGTYRNKGLATAMILKLKETLPVLGFRGLKVFVIPENEPVMKLLSTLGEGYLVEEAARDEYGVEYYVSQR